MSHPGTVPPYQRVAAVLRERIASRTWPPGHRLPSRTDLARELLDARGGENIIRRAQELLIEEGLLEGRTGSGTYVRAPRKRYALRAPFHGLVPEGFDGTWEAQSEPNTPAPEPVAARLRIEPGALCVRTEYTVLAPGRKPVLSTTSWEPMALTGATPVVLPTSGPLAGRSVAARMAHLGLTVDHITETLAPVALDHDQARGLSAPAGSLAFRITRVHFAVGGRPVETADLLVPAAYWEVNYDHRQVADGAGASAWAGPANFSV
ncbi:GntR family transcriptional regulator [Streptomyces graminilatus]|uniref:GntR family transcriptional regulator n=1 Tax=Streptomyces graminilatus TaxID=1464070 RepID=UPI0007C72002|nr:GntR family transcriptional regulator [Streptomyces graminilatus]